MSHTESHNRKVRQVEAISNGTVIDHIPCQATLKVAGIIASPEHQLFIGNNFRTADGKTKGVIKISGVELDDKTLDQIALLAPEATINIIRDYEVVQKHQVSIPEYFFAIAQCGNPNCITNHQEWATRFNTIQKSPLTVKCHYCERVFDGKSLEIS